MPSLTFFYTIFLLSCIGSWSSVWTYGSPIPSPNPPVHAATNHPQHADHVAQATHPNTGTLQPHHLHPNAVHAHAIGQTGHVMGTVEVHPDKRHTMTQADLHAHAQHAKEKLQATHPNHEIHAAHIPGESHVHFHATPPGHHQTGDIHHALSKTTPTYGNNVYNDSPFKNNQHSTHYIQAKDGVHGRGVGGTIALANTAHHAGMTPQQLHQHAQDIRHALAPGQHETTRVHVTHNPGDNHIRFHALPAHGRDLVRPDLHDKTLTPQQHATLNQHFNHGIQVANPHHYSHSVVAGSQNPHDHTKDDRTFHGTVLAHSTAKMNHAELDRYAQVVKKQLIHDHGIHHSVANDMVVAATHKEGDTHVHFHTQPKTTGFLNQLASDQHNYHQFNDKLRAANHLKSDGAPWHHAELGALRDSLIQKGATADTFDHHIQGHVIGVSGRGDKPCDACHRTLAQLPVEYKGMNRDTTPGTQRGL